MTDQPTTDPTHGLSVQHADALWDAVAIPGPTEPTFPMQHERVCRAVAGILDELRTPPAVPVSSPPPDQTAVLQRAADDLAEFIALHGPTSRTVAGWRGAVGFLRRMAAEAQAQQPGAETRAPADRAAVLLEAAEVVDNPDGAFASNASDWGFIHARTAMAAKLRRLAAEAQQPDTETQAHPPIHAWRVETRDPLADQWAPGSHFAHRPNAVERWETANRTAPLWKDGTPVERRIVRETTTFTVEEPPPAHIGGNADDCPACQAQGLHTIGHPYECPGPDTAGAGD